MIRITDIKFWNKICASRKYREKEQLMEFVETLKKIMEGCSAPKIWRENNVDRGFLKIQFNLNEIFLPTILFFFSGTRSVVRKNMSSGATEKGRYFQLKICERNLPSV